MTDAERVISRAQTLMRLKGYSWSKAMAVAAETMKKEQDNASKAG